MEEPGISVVRAGFKPAPTGVPNSRELWRRHSGFLIVLLSGDTRQFRQGSRFDDKQRLAELDELAVLRDDFDDGAFHRRAHAIEDFHHFDQTHRRVFGDLLADLDEGRRAGLRRNIKSSQNRCGNR